MLASKFFPFLSDPIEKDAYRDAFKASGGTMVGIAAWGMVTGMAMVKSGLTLAQALGMSLTVFAGSAQLAALPLIFAGVPVWVVFFTAMVVNLRFVIFAAAIGPHFAHLPWYKRLFCGYFNADVTSVFFPQRFPQVGEQAMASPPAGKLGYYTGICFPNWIAWQSGSVTGILLAAQIPDSWGIGFAGTLALLAVLVPMTVNIAALGGVIVSGITAVLCVSFPYRLGLLLAVVLGMVVAMVIDTVLDDTQAGDVE
jgi:predicted branched-subunit amino acid permease